jgi:hypothetical protein
MSLEKDGADVVHQLPLPLAPNPKVIKTRTLKPLPSKRNLKSSAESLPREEKKAPPVYNTHLREV